jgi:hypothetical protein
VLDVPKDAARISFGLLDVGRGEAWLNDVSFGVVTDEVQQPIASFTFTPSATAKLEVLRAFPDLDGE